MANCLKSTSIFSKNWAKVICVVDEKFDTIKLVASVKLGEKPPYFLFRCSRIEA